MERTNNNIHTSRNFFYIFHQPRCINLLYLIIFLIISYIYISLKSPNNPQEHSIIHNAHISRTQSRKPLCRRSIERDSNTRHPGRHKARTLMDHPRVLGGPDVKSLSMIPRVAWWHSSHSFDEPSTTFLGIIQLDASTRKELASNSAEEFCWSLQTRSNQEEPASPPPPPIPLPFFLVLLQLFHLRTSVNQQPVAIVSRDKRAHSRKEFHRIFDYESNCKRYRFFDQSNDESFNAWKWPALSIFFLSNRVGTMKEILEDWRRI